MKYAKIVVKNNYDQRGDLVLRSYIRAIKKIKADLLLDGDKAFIYGMIDNDGHFQEVFTKGIIDYDNYEEVSTYDVDELMKLSLPEIKLIKMIIESVIFGKTNKFDFEISTIEDLAMDRAIEFDAYINYLSRINPYMRLSQSEDQDLYNAYNSFDYKVKVLDKLRKTSVDIQNYDDYDVNNYSQIPKDEIIEKEYNVIKKSKQLIKK